MNRRILIILLAIFALGYLLRVMYLPAGALTFGYDQARDAYVSQSILAGDLKILGPPASTPGLYHGVLYYYVLAPGYIFGQNPINAAYWMAFVSMLTVFAVFYIAKSMTKRTEAGLVAAFLFAISFESTQYAIWLSNPTIAILTVPLFYLGLWIWLTEFKHKKWGPIVAGLAMGASVQADVFLLYHAVPLLIWVYIARSRIKVSDLALFILSGAFAVSTMIFAEIKFGFTSISGATQLLASQETLNSAKSLGDFMVLYLNQLGRVFAFNSYPGNIGYGSMFVFGLIIFGIYKVAVKKKKGLVPWQLFIATWLFSHLTVVTVGGTSTPFLLVGIGPAVSILLGIYIYKWWSTQRLFAVAVIAILIFGNLSIIMRENPRGQTIFSIQKDMLLSKQLKTLDYTYDKANGEKFSVNTVTSPLWISIVWTYLYDWYGAEKYSYTPFWHGKDQIGLLSTLERIEEPLKKSFLILEPPAGIPQRFIKEALDEENSKSTIVEEVRVGEITLQERELPNE